MSKHVRTFAVEMNIKALATVTVKGRRRTAAKAACDQVSAALESSGYTVASVSDSDIREVIDPHPLCALCGYAAWPEVRHATSGRKRIKVCPECWDQLVQEE